MYDKWYSFKVYKSLGFDRCEMKIQIISITPKSFSRPLLPFPVPVNYYIEFILQAFFFSKSFVMWRTFDPGMRSKEEVKERRQQTTTLSRESLIEVVRHKLREEFLKIKNILFVCGMEKAVERELVKILERLRVNDERGPKGISRAEVKSLIGGITENEEKQLFLKKWR